MLAGPYAAACHPTGMRDVTRFGESSPTTIAAAVFYGASAAMAAASASQAQAQTGYMPQNYTTPTGGGAGGGGEGTSAAIRLRGLPFSSTEQDVLAFFAQHDVVDRISEGPKAVSLILRASGKSSGQALVQMRDRADAELAQRVLNGQWMGTRYIEVFLNDEDAEPQNALAAATAERMDFDSIDETQVIVHHACCCCYDGCVPEGQFFCCVAGSALPPDDEVPCMVNVCFLNCFPRLGCCLKLGDMKRKEMWQSESTTAD
ncbi:unnamed protein product [Effrenium voratum]|nr:unnamed protein product [Effrenium voratum]